MGFSVKCYLPIFFSVCCYNGHFLIVTVSGKNTVKCLECFFFSVL